MDTDAVTQLIRSEIGPLTERVIVIEIRDESRKEAFEKLEGEVTWLRRTLWGVMVSLLLMFAGSAVAVLFAA